MATLRSKTVLLGVSGGIAAYKAAELVRLFGRQGASVQVVMTENARHFVTPLTLQVLSDRPVCCDLFDIGLESEIGHIQVARSAHLAVIAPATANVIAKLAAGIADDYLTTVILATTAPVLVCPAMNTQMYLHPATRRNIDRLKSLNYSVMEPEVGELACNEEGPGRLPQPEAIVEAARALLGAASLAGLRVLVSAGPTREPFDPVRFISNPSTGKMGYALAREAVRRGARVHLVSGPSALAPPAGVSVHAVTTAAQMNEVVGELARDMDIIVMAAAVSDYRPRERAAHKIKKRDEGLQVTLERTPDILAGLGRRKRPGQTLVGFAAETEQLIANAKEKLRRKNLDLIVANDLTEPGSGFASDTNRVKIIYRNGRIESLRCMDKADVAAELWDLIEGYRQEPGER